MPSLAIIDLETFWNIEKLSKQQGFGRIVDVTIQSVMTEYPIRLRGAMVARQIPVPPGAS
jgi:hypothetical protein